MQQISYIRTEFHSPDQNCTAALLDFILDIPYLVSRSGIIPPRHVMNEVLKSGGGNDGMSPGAIWESFELSEDEYDELAHALESADMNSLKLSGKSRFIPDDLIIDYRFHRAKNFDDWQQLIADYEKKK